MTGQKTGIIGWLLFAALLLFVGIATLWQQQANWHGVIQISGGQAQLFGILCITYSFYVVLRICFRRRNE